jgi:hypothetical protein
MKLNATLVLLLSSARTLKDCCIVSAAQVATNLLADARWEREEMAIPGFLDLALKTIEGESQGRERQRMRAGQRKSGNSNVPGAGKFEYLRMNRPEHDKLGKRS